MSEGHNIFDLVLIFVHKYITALLTLLRIPTMVCKFPMVFPGQQMGKCVCPIRKFRAPTFPRATTLACDEKVVTC